MGKDQFFKGGLGGFESYFPSNPPWPGGHPRSMEKTFVLISYAMHHALCPMLLSMSFGLSLYFIASKISFLKICPITELPGDK
jgi:hypothetical protein